LRKECFRFSNSICFLFNFDSSFWDHLLRWHLWSLIIHIVGMLLSLCHYVFTFDKTFFNCFSTLFALRWCLLLHFRINNSNWNWCSLFDLLLLRVLLLVLINLLLSLLLISHLVMDPLLSLLYSWFFNLLKWFCNSILLLNFILKLLILTH
jgi:hypothetical protein